MPVGSAGRHFSMKDLDNVLEKCKKNQEKAQRLLFDEMKSVWMGIIIRYVKDVDISKDVFQEAVLKIFTDLGKLKDNNAFAGWARRIVINTSLNYLKERRSYLFALQETTVNEEGGLDRSDEAIILKLDNEILLEIINGMPEGYRAVFNLSMIDGYSHLEIASILNISENTSRSQLSKGRKYLKKILSSLKKTSHERVVGF